MARKKVLSAFFGAYNGYDVSVLQNSVFPDSFPLSRVHCVNEAFTQFRVDKISKLMSSCPVRHEIGVWQDSTIVIG